MPLVQVEDVKKSYIRSSILPWRSPERTVALDGVSFSVDAGEIVGIVGPNGAGKSTLINIISGLLYRDSGSVTLFGLDVQRHRETVAERMNVATAYSRLSSRLTVEENLRVFGRIYGVENPGAQIDRLLDLFEIGGERDKKVHHLSAGQQTRANLCKAFINRPELLLLDEATAGLDPHIAAKTRDAIRDLNEEHGTTIIVTSHNMTDIDELSDRMLFLHDGAILRRGTPETLKAEVHGKEVVVSVDAVTDAFNAVVKQYEGETTERTARFTVQDEGTAMDVIAAVRDADVDVTDLRIEEPDLDAVFTRLAGGDTG